MTKENFPYFLILLLSMLVLSFPYFSSKTTSQSYHGKRIDINAAPFKLRSLKGTEVTEEIYKRKWTFMTFGFSKCTGVCPLNLRKFTKLSDKMMDQDVQFLFVSIDNLRDSKENMEEFASHFSKSLVPLLSGKESGAEIALKYKTNINIDIVKMKEDEDYQINHSGFIYLINPKGKLLLLYADQDVLAEDLSLDLANLKEQHGTVI